MSITIKLLTDCSQKVIPILANLWQREIGKIWTPSENIEITIERFSQHYNKNLPLMFVAFDKELPIGMTCLRACLKSLS